MKQLYFLLKEFQGRLDFKKESVVMTDIEWQSDKRLAGAEWG